MEDLVQFGPMPDFQRGGACYGNAAAHADLHPPRSVGGRALSLDEHDDAVALGIQTWCGSCPIMLQCGEHARTEGYSGPYGGRIFWEGKEVGMAQRHAAAMPGSARRLYSSNLTNHERADRKHCHDLYATGRAQHTWQEAESFVPG